MTAFEIVTVEDYGQKQIVIANTICDARKKFLEEHPSATIEEINPDAGMSMLLLMQSALQGNRKT